MLYLMERLSLEGFDRNSDASSDAESRDKGSSRKLIPETLLFDES